MKKIFNWMLAAILICGASVVTTSCGNDDEENQEPKLTPNTYEVTLSAVLPESAAPFCNLKLEYVDANGKEGSITVKAGDESEEMNDKLKAVYEDRKDFIINMLNLTDEKTKIFDDLIIKNVKFNVPSGKSFSYKGIVNIKDNYEIPETETFDILTPFVFLSSKRISGNTDDFSVFTEELNLSLMQSMETEKIEEILEDYNGNVVAEGTRTMR